MNVARDRTAVLTEMEMVGFPLILVIWIGQVDSKYMEGFISTSDNWAFLARFCFLSEDGEFEYHLEFNEDLGTPNLLLYYDTDDQWPAVYKSHKTCYEKEAVLHVEQNQIINLTTKHTYFRDLSGCAYAPAVPTTPGPRYTMNLPTLTPKNGNNGAKIKSTPRTITTTSTSTTTTTRTTPPATTTAIPFTTTDSYSTDFITTTMENSYTTTDVEDLTTLEAASRNGPTKAPIKKRAVPPQARISGNRRIICTQARRFKSARERWWFIALSNCNGSKGIHVNYKILMTNGPPGDYWHEQFSADEIYILPVLMAFSIAYSFVMLGIIMCSIELKSRQLLHTTYKIFVVSAIFQLFGIIVTSAAYLRYAVNGINIIKVRRLGFILMGASETFFLLLLLLLAKGFTITRGRLPISGSVKITIFMCLYVITYVSIFIYEANVFDPGEVLYLYESPAGYGLISLRVLAWCMFVYSTVFTLKKYPEKSNFYYPFNICGTLWFIAGPAFILSANTYIDKWVRESVVCAVLQAITFGGHLSFLILTMPSLANKNFPYHVRTTQIGIMELTGGTAGASTIEQFGHHVYEPAAGMYNQTGIRNNSYPRTIEETNGTNGYHHHNHRDITMENVANWSMAKNVAAIGVPDFDRFKRRHSFVSDHTDSLPATRRPSTTTSQQENGSVNNVASQFQDYVREVPLELFTISRMVVNKDKKPVDDESPKL